jgi:hypothetical protein
LPEGLAVETQSVRSINFRFDVFMDTFVITRCGTRGSNMQEEFSSKGTYPHRVEVEDEY